MGRLLTVCLLLCFASLARGENLYFTQSGAGSHNGSSIDNAWSVAEASTAGNWGSGAGKVSAGDTLFASGTITSQLTVQGSGSAGSPILIQFMSGTKFSAARWSTAGEGVFSATQAAILLNSKSYITIDGSNSVNSVCIEATNTGTAKTYQDYNVGILAYGGGTGLTFQNMTVTNMYVRTPGSADPNQDGGGFQCRGGVYVDVLITNCASWQANVGYYLGFGAGTSSNFHIRNSRGGDCGEGVFVMGSESGSSVLDDWGIHGCTFQDEYTWSGVADTHCNLIHAHTTAAGALSKNGVVENSTFTGTGSDHMTSFVFFEGALTNVVMRNNLITPSDTTFTGNGYITIKGAYGIKLFNNTIYGTGVGIGIGTTSFGAGYDGGVVMTNNLVYDVSTGAYDPTDAIAAADYNIFASVDYMSPYGALFGDWSDWQAAGFDAHGSSSSPTLDASYVPTGADTVARDKGADLSAYFTTDKNGNTRSGTWDIGAYEYGATSAASQYHRAVSGGIRGGSIGR